jgi:hypothetical protein
MCLYGMPEMVAALARDGDHRSDPEAREPEREPEQPAERAA